jgi:hypothetical protein
MPQSNDLHERGFLIADPSTSTAVIIDPVLNYDPATQAVATHAADSLHDSR